MKQAAICSSSGTARTSDGADLTGSQRPCGVEQPRQRVGELLGRRHARFGQISFDVVHSACQDVQLVVEPVEFRPCDHQLVFTQFELGGSMPGHPVPLAATAGTEDPGSTRAGALRERSTTPTAVSDG